MSLRTIVGGRPSGEGGGGQVPRGIEVLLKKARVDAGFREELRADPAAAAASIGLDLSPVERAVLAAVPRENLLAMADRVEVPEAHRPVFRGRVAAAMLAVVAGASALGCAEQPPAPEPAKANEPVDWIDPYVVCFGMLPYDEGAREDVWIERLMEEE